MKRIPNVPALCLLSCSALALACGGGKKDGDGRAERAASKGKVLQLFRTSAHKTLDPAKQFDSASAEIVSNVYDTLLEYHYLKRPYEIVPNLLAKMPEQSEDGLTYSFELRDGVHFQDDPCFPGGKGRELTTDDVIYSIKRYADANVNVQSYSLWQGAVAGMDEFREQTKQAGKSADYAKLHISGIVKQDDRRFTITLNRSNPLALLPLAASQLSIVPREAVEHYKEEFERRPVGTGPFRLETLSLRGVTVLVKNPNYHGTYPTEGEAGDDEKGLLAARGKRVPFIDRIELPLIEEPQPAMLKFLTGQLDMIGMDRDNFVKMAYRDETGFHLRPDYAKNFEISSAPALSMEYFVFNLQDPLLGKNKALRQAFAHALDTPAFIDQMRNGRGVPLKTMVPIPIAGSQEDLEAQWYEPNIAKAKQKLAEAGYPDGKGLAPIVIDYRNSSTITRQEFEFQRAQLAKAGIVLKANFQTFSAYLQKVDRGNFQMTLSGWQADYPDAENFYQLLYGPNKPPGPNYSSYANPEYDKLYEQVRFMPDGPERHALFKRMNEIIREDVPIVFTWTPTAVGLRQRWVMNHKRNMMIDLPAKYLDIDTALKAKGLK
jgi:oligopeptide transport system substrate-binding protein